MAETTTFTVSGRRVHGSGVASCGSYPDIKVSFTLQFTRDSINDPTVHWSMTSLSWSHPTSGSFGYKFQSTISVSMGSADGGYAFLNKNNTTANSWWNAVVLDRPTNQTLSNATGNTVNIYIRVRKNSSSWSGCMSSGHFCYGDGGGYYTVATYKATLPTYAAQSTITYDANGGTDAPAPQIKEAGESITLSTTEPIFPCSINYHNITTPSSVIVYRPFLEWNTAQDGSGTSYAPGATYTADANLTLYAQWGDATFIPVSLEDQFITVTYNVGSSIGLVPPTQHQRTELGYATSQGSTTVVYQVGTTYNNITGDIDLYPVYGDATVAYATLPVPTNPGYEFVAWYRDPELTHIVDSDILTSVDITLYAEWKLIPVRKFENNSWQRDGVFVWKFNGSTWQKIAPIYAYNYYYNEWTNMSGNPVRVTHTTDNSRIAAFDTLLTDPIIELKATITPTQESGTPSPQSPKAIIGVNTINFVHCGPNLWDEQWESGTLDDDTGMPVADVEFSRSADFIPVKPNSNVYLYISGLDPELYEYEFMMFRYDENKNFIDFFPIWDSGLENIEQGIYYIKVVYKRTYSTISNYKVAINIPGAAMQYSPYKGETISVSLGNTYYGGQFIQDAAGHRKFRKTHEYIASYNGETISGPWISSMDVYSQGATPTTGAQVVYPITPVDIDRPDGSPIRTFTGHNNIYNDVGKTQVVYDTVHNSGYYS